MKVQILLTKEVPGNKVVNLSEVPEWMWQKASRFWPYVAVVVVGSVNSESVTIYGTSSFPSGSTYRVYNSKTRQLLSQNITPGPWVVQDPPTVVPLTVDEVLERFPATEWDFLKVYNGENGYSLTVKYYPLDAVTHTSPGPLLALNRRTLECVKIAEVVE